MLSLKKEVFETLVDKCLCLDPARLFSQTHTNAHQLRMPAAMPKLVSGEVAGVCVRCNSVEGTGGSSVLQAFPAISPLLCRFKHDVVVAYVVGKSLLSHGEGSTVICFCRLLLKRLILFDWRIQEKLEWEYMLWSGGSWEGRETSLFLSVIFHQS